MCEGNGNKAHKLQRFEKGVKTRFMVHVGEGTVLRGEALQSRVRFSILLVCFIGHAQNHGFKI